MFPISDSVPTRRFPLLNIAIIAFTVFVFIEQIIAPNQEAFIISNSLVPAFVNLNNPSTLFTFVSAIFLHGGILHILSNMWFLWVFGDNVEIRLGWILFPVLYLMSGVAGNLMQYIFIKDSLIPMLGASGSIAGILGAYFVFFPKAQIKTFLPIFVFFTVIDVPASFMLGYWFLLQIFSGALTIPFLGDGGVAFWAHVGGFLTGLIFALIIKNRNKSPSQIELNSAS